MICQLCSSEKLKRFAGEVAIHFPGLRGLNKPIVWVFPEIWVCLDCGNAGLSVPDRELQILAAGDDDDTVPDTSCVIQR